MSSINLSFKEWPFSSDIDDSHAQSTNSPLVRTPTIEMLQSQLYQNAPKKKESSSDSSDVIANQIKNDKTSANKQSQSNSNQINKKKINHLSSWGRCELFACTFGGCLSVFSNDYNDCLSPLFMFSPFEQFNVGKTSKPDSKGAIITAIAWANGLLQPSLAKPILALSSDRGHIIIYDFNSKGIIGNIHMNEPVISILWSSFKLNRFYVGTKTGHFYVCELIKESIQIMRSINFSTYSAKSTENNMKSIDFIAQDDVDGLTVAIASKDGVVGYITNINDYKNSKLQVFQQLSQTSLNSPNDKGNSVINFLKFYPNYQDAIMIATDTSTFLMSFSKGILIPFIPATNCKFISLLDNENDMVVVGNEIDVTIWKLVNQTWVRSNSLIFTGKLGQTEILTFSKLQNKFLLTTASDWLTEIIYKKKKIFVSKRIKMINGIPLDYDFGNGSIAILTDNNSISFTAMTPQCVGNPKFTSSRRVSLTGITPFQKTEVSNLEDYISDDDNEASSNLDDEDEGGISLSHSHSMTFQISSNSSNISLKQIPLNEKKNKIPLGLSSISKTSTNFFDTKEGLAEYSITEQNNFNVNDSLIGNSNSFSLSFNCGSIIKHIEWISSMRLVAWNKRAFYLIDLKTRTISDPLKNKFDKQCNKITQMFFSKSHKLMCFILNHQIAYILNTESKMKIINSVNFGDKIQNNYNCLCGCFSPDEKQIVFVIQNILFIGNVNDKEVLNVKQISSNFEFIASFISWKTNGIFIGTEKGTVFIIPKQKVDSFSESPVFKYKEIKVIFDQAKSGNEKTVPIKLVKSCINNSYIIIDSTGKGFVISGDIIKNIADDIRVFRMFSKETFLIRLQKYSMLIAMNAIGEFVPPPPPCYFETIKNNYSFKPKKYNLIKLSDENDSLSSVVQQLFRINIDKPSTAIRNNIHLLNQIISLHDEFNTFSSKLSLILGDPEKSRDILLQTNPTDAAFLNNMMLAALYNSSYDSIQVVIQHLLSNNMIFEAADILLISKQTYHAVETLYKFEREKEACTLLLLTDHEKNSDKIRDLAKQIAYSLIKKKENILLGLKLLASYGCTHEMITNLASSIQ